MERWSRSLLDFFSRSVSPFYACVSFLLLKVMGLCVYIFCLFAQCSDEKEKVKKKSEGEREKSTEIERRGGEVGVMSWV